jgi:hypothetical protein
MPHESDYLIGRIRQALAEDPRVNKQDVRVIIRENRVHIIGDTATEERREAIGLVVRETVPGLEVRNEINVRRVTGPTPPEVI